MREAIKVLVMVVGAPALALYLARPLLGADEDFRRAEFTYA